MSLGYRIQWNLYIIYESSFPHREVGPLVGRIQCTESYLIFILFLSVCL